MNLDNGLVSQEESESEQRRGTRMESQGTAFKGWLKKSRKCTETKIIGITEIRTVLRSGKGD